MQFIVKKLYILMTIWSLCALLISPPVFAQELPLWPKYLGSESYVGFKAQRLAKPRLLWLNHDLLNKMGITATPEELMDAYAYSIPQVGDPPDAFSEKFLEFFASRYGGDCLAGNLGDGRSAARGQFRVKGIARTPLATQPLRMSMDMGLRQLLKGCMKPSGVRYSTGN